MLDYAYRELYQKDSVDKKISISYDGGKITNTDLYSESFELKESICSESELRFGSCEASMLKFKIANTVNSLKGKVLEVSEVLNGKSDSPFLLGKYKVDSDVPSGDRNYRNITAYDSMYDIINTDVITWYEGLEFPLTMKEFRDSFFQYMNVTQEETELIQDDVLIEKTIDADSISGLKVISTICELNGVFGHINRNGNFEYISLGEKKTYLYPDTDFYPSDTNYPNQILDTKYESNEIPTGSYISCEYEDFETNYISKLQIRQEENDIGAVYGSGNNCYIVEDNFLVYGKSSKELSDICIRLFGKISGVSYRPFKATVKGNPCLMVGDMVKLCTRTKEVEGYVLERTLKGIQSLRDTLEAKGVLEYEEKVNSAQSEMKRLKGKSNILERTIEETKSMIKNVETVLETQIKQTASEIELMAKKDEIIALINLSAEEAKIKALKIALEGLVTVNENVKILEDGTIVAKNGTFEGKIISNSAEITGGSINIETSASDDSVIKLKYQEGYTSIFPGAISIRMDDCNTYIHPLMFYMRKGSTDLIFASLNTNKIYIKGATSISGDFSVSGTKSRIAKTKSYNDRLLYCYEMPSPIFGDVGHGVIGEDGLCYVDIDPIFFETIDTGQNYHVFLQSYSEHPIYVFVKQQDYFVVKGIPGTEFDWELKAKQLDFPIERLDENIEPEDYEDVDYISSASEYLNNYEKELMDYEY